MGAILTTDQRNFLLAQHRTERDRHRADRIKAVLLRDDGGSYEPIAAALFLSNKGVRRQIEDYLKKNGKLKPENGGSMARLSAGQLEELDKHLSETIYVRTQDIVAYVQKPSGAICSLRGMTKLLHRLGFSYPKPVGVPAKADGEAQKTWIACYAKLKKSLPDNAKILFLDGLHPPHAVRFQCGWIKKGGRQEIPTNRSQRRLNILGAVDLEDMAIHTQQHAKLNADAGIAFLVHLLTALPHHILHIVLDQARYHSCAAVREGAAKNPRIHLHFLPAYSPNLNAIEPVWKIRHENTVNNIYSPTFTIFTEKIRNFFADTFPKNAHQWIDRLTDNFRPLSSPLTTNS